MQYYKSTKAAAKGRTKNASSFSSSDNGKSFGWKSILLVVLCTSFVAMQFTTMMQCNQDALAATSSFANSMTEYKQQKGKASQQAQAQAQVQAQVQSQSQTQYTFETIPSRAWKIFENPFPCHAPPKNNKRINGIMLTTPAHEGILFQRPEKVGSTTMTNIVMRLAHNRGRTTAEDNNTTNNATNNNNNKKSEAKVRCQHRSIHGSAISYDYEHRNRKKSFLFSMVRDPTKTLISKFFHFKVSINQNEPTDAIFSRFALTPGMNNNFLRQLTYDKSLGSKMTAEYEQFLERYQREQTLNNQTDAIETRKPEKRFLGNGTAVKPLNHTQIVGDILDHYDFIAVTERLDESLVAFKILMGLTVNDILYAKNSRSAGSFSNGHINQGRPCVYLIPSFLTKHMRDFFYAPPSNKKWIEYTRGDALLHRAASESLDRTIDEVFGRDRFDRELSEFRNALEYARAVCASEPGLVVGMCDDGGESVAHDPDRRTTCYIWGEGCDHKCLNERVPSPIPQSVLDGTQTFGNRGKEGRTEEPK